MATKIFCDGCGRPMDDGYELPTGVVPNDIAVNVLLTSARTGGADVCKYCIIDAFNKLDDRQPARAMRGELGARGHQIIDTNKARFVVDPDTGAWLKHNGLPNMALHELSPWFPLADPKRTSS